MHAYRTEAGICCVKFKVVVKIFFKSTKILAFIKKSINLQRGTSKFDLLPLNVQQRRMWCGEGTQR